MNHVHLLFGRICLEELTAFGTKKPVTGQILYGALPKHQLTTGVLTTSGI